MIYAVACCAGCGEAEESWQLAVCETRKGFWEVRPANAKATKGPHLMCPRDRKRETDWSREGSVTRKQESSLLLPEVSPASFSLVPRKQAPTITHTPEFLKQVCHPSLGSPCPLRALLTSHPNSPEPALVFSVTFSALSTYSANPKGKFTVSPCTIAFSTRYKIQLPFVYDGLSSFMVLSANS